MWNWCLFKLPQGSLSSLQPGHSRCNSVVRLCRMWEASTANRL